MLQVKHSLKGERQILQIITMNKRYFKKNMLKQNSLQNSIIRNITNNIEYFLQFISMTDNSYGSQIVALFQMSLRPEAVVQATKKIEQLRKIKGYLSVVMKTIEQRNTDLCAEVKMALLVEISNCIKLFRISKDQFQVINIWLGKFIWNYANDKNHKILRQMIRNMTSKYGDSWADLKTYIDCLQYKHQGQQNNRITWLVSALIGFIEACPSFLFSRDASLPKVKKFYPLFATVVKRGRQCFPDTYFYVSSFTYNYIYSCNPNQVLDLEKELKLTLSNSVHVWRACVNKEKYKILTKQDFSFYERSRDQMLKSLIEWLSKYQMYIKSERTDPGMKTQLNLQIWNSPQIEQLLELIIKEISAKEVEQNQVIMHSIKFISMLIRTVQVEFIIPHVQNLLYITIPKLLFNLREIVLCQGVPLAHFQDRYNNVQLKTKQALLQLWKLLSRINLSDIQKQRVERSLMGQSSRKVENILSTFQIHFKFIFQKMTQIETFFSPYSFSNDLIRQDVWSSKDKQWIIVAFDLIKIMCEDLRLPSNIQIRKTLPQILLSVVMPRIITDNKLLQAHSVSVLTTYHAQFCDLHISKPVVDSLKQMLSRDASKTTKDVILRVLPGLVANLHMAKLVKQIIQDIVPSYLNLIFQENGDQQITRSFVELLALYGNKLQNPQHYLDILMDMFINVDFNNSKINMISYTDCIGALLKVPMDYQKIRLKLVQMVFITLNYDDPNFDKQIVQEELLRIIGDYIGHIRQTNRDITAIFAMYCLSFSGFNQHMTHKINLPTILSQIPELKSISKPCSPECAQNMLWILQVCSLKRNFCEWDNNFQLKPITLYLMALEFGLERFRNIEQEGHSQIYYQFVQMIVQGLISVVEESKNIDQEAFSTIWSFVVRDIIWKMKDQIFQVDQKPIMDQNQGLEDWNELAIKSQLCLIRRSIVSLLSSMLYFHQEFAQICFRQTQNNNIDMIQGYLQLLDICLMKKSKKKLFRKRLVLGLTCFMEFQDLSEQDETLVLKLLKNILQSQKARELKFYRYYNGRKNSSEEQVGSSEKSDQEELSEDEEDDHEEYIEDYQPYNLESLKFESAMDDEFELQTLHDTIELLIEDQARIVTNNKNLVRELKDSLSLLQNNYDYY